MSDSFDMSDFFTKSDRFSEGQRIRTADSLSEPDAGMRRVLGEHRLEGRAPGMCGHIVAQALQKDEYWFVRHDDGTSAAYRPSELEEIK